MGIDVTISSAQCHPHCSWKCKFLLLSIHNICLGWEIRKLIFWYALDITKGMIFLSESVCLNIYFFFFCPHWASFLKLFSHFSGHFYHPLITFANSLDPTCRAWSGSKLFDNLMVFPKDFFENINFEKKLADNKAACKVTQHAKSIWII